MSNIKKGNLGKKLLIAFCIMAAILTTAGIIIICNRPHTGTEQVLAGNTSLQEKIYQDTDVLSDEEFIYGITNMIPSDNTDDSVITSALAALKQAYMNTVGVDCYAEYINYFGTPAAYLKLPDTIELTKVLTPLQQDTVFTKIYVLLTDSELGVVHTEYVYSDGEISEVYLPHMLTPTDASEDIKQLADSLIAEYNLTPEDFKYSGGELEINVEILSNSDALSLFDYSFQYLLQNHPGINLVLRSGDILYASGLVEETYEYKKYYPHNDLAPLFRLSYYYQYDFLKNSLRSTAKQLYL